MLRGSSERTVLNVGELKERVREAVKPTGPAVG